MLELGQPLLRFVHLLAEGRTLLGKRHACGIALVRHYVGMALPWCGISLALPW